MKTQVSREGYRWQQRYSGVYQQQGRMITDSDWNELVDILKARVDETLVDVVGRGMPKGRAVQIQMVAGVPRFVPGHVYAAGVEGAVDPIAGAALPFGFNQQKDFPSAPPLPPTNSNLPYRLYADVWDRAVTSLEDEALRDPALHGADTCARTQRMAQIKTCAANLDPQFFPVTGDSLLTLRYPQGGGPSGADPCDSQADLVDPVGGDFLFRLEVHDVRWPNATAAPNEPSRVVIKWSRENGAEQYPFDELPDWFTTGQWIYELFDAESEKHLGYHRPALAPAQSWVPKVGALVTALPQTAPPNTRVRRWEGYCVLLRNTAGTWSTSTTAGETHEETAPGIPITFGSVQHGETSFPTTVVSLADLQVTLEVGAKVFLPGDYWTAPVRRATYAPDTTLLEGAFPSGVIHRYVTLGTVQANATLQARTAAEQRRLAFPRLTEIDAEDIGYGTTCNSGLFTSAHDTVEKALDRLCSINATHVGFTKTCDTSIFQGSNPTTVAQALALLCSVTANQIGYTTTCTSGLFDNTHDTVKKALDRLCSIGAQHVGFTKPGDTSIYKGVNPTTVAQALNLLANVQATQIGYSPASNPNVVEVKAALDELYARPVGNGSRVYIGPGGQFASIDVAMSALLAQNKKDIALALLPGDHNVPANWNPGNLTDVNLSILGLGEASRLRFQGGNVTFSQLSSFRMDQVDAIFLNSSRMTVSNSREVVLLDNRLEGSKLVNAGLVTFLFNTRAAVRDNIIDVQPELLDANLVPVLGLDAFENVTDLFTVSLTEFRTRAQTLGQTLNALPIPNRSTVGQNIVTHAATAFQGNQITADENNAYAILGGAISGGQSGANLARELENVRHVVYVKHPGSAIVLDEAATGPVLIEGNRSNGLIGLHGLPRRTSTFLNAPSSSFFNAGHNGRFSLLSPRHALQVMNNQVAGLRLGENMMNLLMLAVNSGITVSVNGAYRSIQVLGNQFENEDNVFMADEVNLSNNQFLSAANANAIAITAGWTVGNSAMYLSNRGRLPTNLLNSGPVNANFVQGANFRFAVVTLIIT